jgi:Methyltransferase domain
VITLADLLAKPPELHKSIAGNLVNMGLSADALGFIDAHVGPESHTLETGAGTSTILFALKGAKHICITPSAEEIDMIREFCRANGIETAGLTPICAASERALPTLETEALDLVLIDGRHGFPAPMIDFFYTVGKLKVGGHLLIDDVELSTCRFVRDLLAEQPEWRLVAQLSRSAVFQKLAEGSEWTDWTHQPYVVRTSTPSRARQVITHLRNREFSAIGRKVWRRVAAGRRNREGQRGS